MTIGEVYDLGQQRRWEHYNKILAKEKPTLDDALRYVCDEADHADNMRQAWGEERRWLEQEHDRKASRGSAEQLEWASETLSEVWGISNPELDDDAEDDISEDTDRYFELLDDILAWYGEQWSALVVAACTYRTAGLQTSPLVGSHSVTLSASAGSQ